MTSPITVRIDAQTKRAAQKTLRDLGLDLSSGVRLFLEQVVATESIPFFPVTKKGLRLQHWKIYKKEIAEAQKSGKSYRTAKEMHADIFK